MQLEILPEFPRTMHLPYRPNTSRGDLVASEEEAKAIFNAFGVCFEEKIDGASVGMALDPSDNAIIRNRTHILRKGYSKKTAAKQQFSPIWTWFYDHEKMFRKLNKAVRCTCGVYGEWMHAVHTITYDQLPVEGRQTAKFIAYDVYDVIGRRFYTPKKARRMLQDAGFTVSHRLDTPSTITYEAILAMAQERSVYSSTEQREGIYIKVDDSQKITGRFKLRRPGFVPSENWDPEKLTPQPKSLLCGK